MKPGTLLSACADIEQIMDETSKDHWPQILHWINGQYSQKPGEALTEAMSRG